MEQAVIQDFELFLYDKPIDEISRWFGGLKLASSPYLDPGSKQSSMRQLSASESVERPALGTTSVSEDIDKKIRDQVAAGVFPIRLKAEEWTSGEINWLLDVIANDQKTTTSVVANFKKVVDSGDLRIHPIVARLLGKEALEKLGVARSGGSS